MDLSYLEGLIFDVVCRIYRGLSKSKLVYTLEQGSGELTLVDIPCDGEMVFLYRYSAIIVIILVNR